MAYRSFVPNPLPPAPPVELTEDIVALLVCRSGERRCPHSKCRIVRIHVCAQRGPDVLSD